MLKRIRIRGYKSLQDVDIELRPLSVLFGPNAAGKSNLLDAMQLLSRMATRTLTGAFDPPYRGKPLESFTFGPGGIPELLLKDSAEFSFEAEVELSPAVIRRVDREIRLLKDRRPVEEGTTTEDGYSAFVRHRHLRYSVSVEIVPRTGIMRVSDEALVKLSDSGEPVRNARTILARKRDHYELKREDKNGGGPSQLPLNMDRTVLSMDTYKPHHAHLAAMREELSSWSFFYFEPRERMRAPGPAKEARHIGLMGQDLAAFLHTLRALEPRQFTAVERALSMVIPSVTGIETAVNAVGEVELRLREGDMLVPARVVSEGTLRVLGFLALDGVKEPPALVGFEEPENGVHPRRIELIAERLKAAEDGQGPQFIVTTHSPLLCDLVPLDSLIVCRRSQGRTTIEPFHSGGPLLRESEVAGALTPDDELLRVPISERILRGDFDA